MTARRFDEDNLGSEVGEDAAGERGGLAGQVDDASAVEEGGRHVGVAFLLRRPEASRPDRTQRLLLTRVSAYSAGAPLELGGTDA
jgi:hypothetical protein